jgi:phosphate transport system protein
MTRPVDPVLKNLRELVLRMGSRAEAILEKSLRAVRERQGALADEVAGDDVEIDRLDVRIDDAVLKALALQQPVAEDLREVIAIKMAAVDLERVGDLARSIAKSAKRLSRAGEAPLPGGLAQLAVDSQAILRQALDAFGALDSAAARRVLDQDDRIDAEQEAVVLEELAAISGDATRASRAIDLIFIAKNLERVGDHATNIAENVILVAEARNVKHESKLRL